MLNNESLKAFVLAAELGSFSAAARHMRKAQSAVSTAISNLEADTGLQLFDRGSRSPTLTAHGQSLLPYAKGILLGNQEFMAKATSMADDIEDTLCVAVERGLHLDLVLEVVALFAEEFPYVSLEMLTTGPNDTATLLKEGRADIGVMTELESYPTGFQFRGVGYTEMVPVCGKSHPLADLQRVSYSDLRQHRQIIFKSRSPGAIGQVGEDLSAAVWHSESPDLIVDMVTRGMGWAEVPLPIARRHIEAGTLVRMAYAFQQSVVLAGVDVVWTERYALGQAGHWLQSKLFDIPEQAWQG